MNLDKWMKGPPTWKNKDLAEKLELDPSYLSEIRNGRIPSLSTAKKISDFTENQVTVQEILQLENIKPEQIESTG